MDLSRLNKEQQIAVNKTKGPVLIIAGAGTGKALVNGTNVLTEYGYKPIELLQKGDKVYGKDGCLHTVLGVFPQGEKQVVEICFSDKTKIYCCEEHLWNIICNNKIKTLQTKKIIKQLQKNECYIPTCDPIQFDEKYVPLSSYSMGIYLNFYNNKTKIDLDHKSEIILEMCDKMSQSNNDFAIYLNQIKNKEIYSLPSEYKYNNIKNRCLFVQGLFFNKNYFETHCYNFARDIQFILETLSISSEIIKNNTIYKVIPFTDKKLMRLTPSNIEDYKTVRKIDKITYLSEYKNMTCIKVDSEDELFLTEHCIVTHNTTVLTYRLAKLLEDGVNPEKILLLTFTNKAAKEMTIRANALLDHKVENLKGTTYHAFCAEFLRKNTRYTDFNIDFKIFDESDCKEILNLIKERMFSSLPEKFPDGGELLSIFSYMINKNKTLVKTLENRYPEHLKYKTEIENIKEEYHNYKIKNNILDYDDLLVYTIKVLEENKTLCKRLSNTYQYIMVDEYQDSNLLQMKLLLLLRQFDNKNICVVGDPEQCLVKGTKINTEKGQKNIEEIDITDRIEVACGYGRTTFVEPESLHLKEIHENIITIKTEHNVIQSTKNHTFFAIPNKKNEKITEDELSLTFDLFYNDKSKLEIVYYHDKDKKIVRKYTDQDMIIDDGDKLIDLMDHIKTKAKNINEHKYARLTQKELFEYICAKDLNLDDQILIYDNGTLKIEKIIEIQMKYYNGFVYDINIPKYRNYFANNICVHNCIYGFRGSEHKNILEFPDLFEDCEVIKLNQNYRSNQEILDVSNQILTTEGILKNELKGTYHIGYKPKLVQVETQKDEAEFVYSMIRKYHREGIEYNEMAVLCRGSFDSNSLEALFTRDGKIPYKKFGGIKFLERQFVKNIFSYLKIMIDEQDEISWFRLLKLYPGLGKVNAKKITDGILSNTRKELLDKKYEKRQFGKYLKELSDFLDKIHKYDFPNQMDILINQYYYKVIKRSIEKKNTKESTKKKELNALERDILDAQILIGIAKDYKSIRSFINDLTLDLVIEDEEEYVTISTVHSAKGLEFKKVFVLNCTLGSFPWDKNPRSNTIEAQEEYEEEKEEEKRIFYVAITRAKEDLYLMYPELNLYTRQYMELSPFLDQKNVIECLDCIDY